MFWENDHALTGESGFRWGTEEQSASESLKALMIEPPVLTIPYNHGHFVLDTDA